MKSATETREVTAPTSVVPDVAFASIIATGMTRIIRDILLSVAAAQEGATPEVADCLDTKTKDKAICISLRVDRSDVRLPIFLRKLLNEKRSLLLTIILDNYFRDLVVGETGFEVTLQFQQAHGRPVNASVSIPFSAISMIRIGENRLDFVPFIPDGNGKPVVAGASVDPARPAGGVMEPEPAEGVA